MSGREAIEFIVQCERENAESELNNFNGVERLSNAFLAEAALPARRPEWVTWARKQAKSLKEIAKKLDDLLSERAP